MEGFGVGEGSCVTYAMSHFFDLPEEVILERLLSVCPELTTLEGIIGVQEERKALATIGETFGLGCSFMGSEHPSVANFLEYCDDEAYLCYVPEHVLAIKNKKIYDCLGETHSMSERIYSLRRRRGILSFFKPDVIENKDEWLRSYPQAFSLIR